MKKIYTFLLAALMVCSASAQVSFWCASYGRVSYDEGVTYRDTVCPRVACQYRADEIDSISFASADNQLTRIRLWKAGEVFSDPRMCIHNDVYRAGVEANPSWRNSYIPIDSIAWYPYALQSVLMPVRDTLPVRTMYGVLEYEYEYPVYPDPMHASYTYELQVDDPSIVRAHVVNKRYNEMLFGVGSSTRMYLYVAPLAVGETNVSITFDGKIKKSFRVVVTPQNAVADDEITPIDSLYSKIFNRLVVTGNITPAGDPDLKNVDEGQTSFYRTMFTLQENPSDQIYWIWNDPGITELGTNKFNVDNPIIEQFFHRLYYNIWMCNSYMKRTKDEAGLAAKRAEIRFVRAYLYYQLLDMFGSVPLVTDNSFFTTTKQNPRAEVYLFVESELLEAERDLPEAGHKTNYYGVDKAAAWLLLSRLYLNGGVYADKNDYGKAAEYAHKVIASSYDLATNYKWLFYGDNDQRSKVNDAWKEMILTIPQGGMNMASWGGSKFAICSFASSQMPATGDGDYWQCYTSRKQLVNLFCADPSSVSGTADDISAQVGDDRALFCNTYNGATWYCGSLSAGDFQSGWALQKWTNLLADKEYERTAPAWPETDLPLLRKAEAYLNYAEAVLRGGSEIDGLTALKAVNTIRERANAAPMETVALDDLLDERGREFYAEGYRRTDLIRFDKFGGSTGYSWELKHGAIRPNMQSFPAYMNVYPIPALFMNAIPEAKQNEGY